MKLVAIIVLSIIIITYMFYSSIREDFGKKKKKNKKKNNSSSSSGPYKRDQADYDPEKCMKKQQKRAPKCMFNSGTFDKPEWVKCDKNNKKHKSTIKAHEEMLGNWMGGYCLNKALTKMFVMNSVPPTTAKWMQENYKHWVDDNKVAAREEIPVLWGNTKLHGLNPIWHQGFVQDKGQKKNMKQIIEFEATFPGK